MALFGMVMVVKPLTQKPKGIFMQFASLTNEDSTNSGRAVRRRLRLSPPAHPETAALAAGAGPIASAHQENTLTLGDVGITHPVQVLHRT